MEDLAYFAMDFRKELSTPGVAPYQASVANYTDDYILFISSSKAFSYAGQRIGMMVISQDVNSEIERLDMTDMPNGLYIIQVQNKDGLVSSHKINKL